MTEDFNDFVKRFDRSGTRVHEKEAAKYHDRFVSTRPADREFVNRAYAEGAAEYIARLSDRRFHDATRNAISRARRQQTQHLFGSILKALRTSSGQKGLKAIANRIGLSTTDPSTMTTNDGTRLLNYVREERCDLLRQTLSQQPWFIKAMGNRTILGGLSMAATRLVRK